MARANALEDNVVLYKTIKGVRTSLDIIGRKGGYGVKVPVPSGQWHTLRCEFAGTRFKVMDYWNGMIVVGVPVVNQQVTIAHKPRTSFRLWGEF